MRASTLAGAMLAVVAFPFADDDFAELSDAPDALDAARAVIAAAASGKPEAALAAIGAHADGMDRLLSTLTRQ